MACARHRRVRRRYEPPQPSTRHGMDNQNGKPKRKARRAEPSPLNRLGIGSVFPAAQFFFIWFSFPFHVLLNVKSQARNFLVQPNFRVSGIKIQFLSDQVVLNIITLNNGKKRSLLRTPLSYY